MYVCSVGSTIVSGASVSSARVSGSCILGSGAVGDRLVVWASRFSTSRIGRGGVVAGIGSVTNSVGGNVNSRNHKVVRLVCGAGTNSPQGCSVGYSMSTKVLGGLENKRR